MALGVLQSIRWRSSGTRCRKAAQLLHHGLIIANQHLRARGRILHLTWTEVYVRGDSGWGRSWQPRLYGAVAGE